jgi:hypothetical protein
MSYSKSLLNKVELRALEILHEYTFQGRELAWEIALAKALTEERKRKLGTGSKVRLF